jgi:hypothetical protein
VAEKDGPSRRRPYRRRSSGPLPPGSAGGWEGDWWTCPESGCGYGERSGPDGNPLGSGVCGEHKKALRPDAAGPPSG